MLNVGLAGSVQKGFNDAKDKNVKNFDLKNSLEKTFHSHFKHFRRIVHFVSDSLTSDFSWKNAIFQDSFMDVFDTSADWSFLFVAFGTGFSGFFSHDFSGTNDQNVFAREFLFQFSNDFGLDLLPAGNLLSWDHQDQSVSSANIDFFDGNNVKLHKLFFGGGIGTVLDFKKGLSDVVLDVGSPLVVFLLEFVGDGEDHVRKFFGIFLGFLKHVKNKLNFEIFSRVLLYFSV